MSNPDLPRTAEHEHVELEPVDTEEPIEHPDDLTDAQAADGHRVYQAVDDLDDDSTGLDATLLGDRA